MPISTMRCRACRKGLMAVDRVERALGGCRICGGGQWVPVRRLTLTDRLRLPRHTGYPPWVRHVPDPEVRW